MKKLKHVSIFLVLDISQLHPEFLLYFTLALAKDVHWLLMSVCVCVCVCVCVFECLYVAVCRTSGNIREDGLTIFSLKTRDI